MISIVEIIQQRILHHEGLNELKATHDPNAINEFEKFKSTFASEKNATNCEILNSLESTNDELEDLIEINDNEVEVKWQKTKNDTKMINDEYKNIEYEDNKNKNKNEVNHEIVVILD